MSVQTVRFRTSPERAAAVVDQIAALFAAVPDGAENPLPSIPTVAAFRGRLPGQTDDDTASRSCTVLGRYSA